MAFFQECWDIVQPDLIELFQEFHLNGKIPRNLNSNFITLIPKKIAAIRIQDFIPLSGPYQIIANVLSNRIHTILHKVIDNNQYAFNKGRNILDSIPNVNECVDDYKRRKKKGDCKVRLAEDTTRQIGTFSIMLWLEKDLVLFGGNGFIAASLRPTFQLILTAPLGVSFQPRGS